MSELAISVEKLGKRYFLGRRQARDTERDRLASVSWLRWLVGSGESAREALWALRDVSFDVKRGEVIGFIGRNGAGKSTLLKVLSRITEPTEGRAVINGRTGTLLEVGTGFHPELTGRENIQLSGAILGMKRAEILRKFDEIVAFAEVERFLDTPVKRYSSGMYVRLAFAVAAHLDPEILFVDEVLAVGDVAFQKKCLGKMGEVAQQGRTVLFVSHNMIAVQNLCNRVIWLNNGGLVQDGPPAIAIPKYLSASFAPQIERVWDDASSAPGNDMVRLHKLAIRPVDAEASGGIDTSTAFDVEVTFWNLVPEARLHVCLHVLNEQQIVAFTTGSNETDPTTRDQPLPAGLFRSVCRVPGYLLNTGVHRMTTLILLNGLKIILQYEDALVFEVVETEKRAGAWYGKEPGVVRPRLNWSTEVLASPDAQPADRGEHVGSLL